MVLETGAGRWKQSRKQILSHNTVYLQGSLNNAKTDLSRVSAFKTTLSIFLIGYTN